MNPKFQFSIRALILVVLAIGVPFACFRMVKQMRVDAALYRRVVTAEEELKFRRAFDTIVVQMDMNDEQHRRAFKIIGRIARQYGSMPGDGLEEWHYPVENQRIPLGDAKNRSVVLFRYEFRFSPWSSDTVAVLMENDKFIDVVVCEATSLLRSHVTAVEKRKHDRQWELKFVCTPYESDKKDPGKIFSYPINDDGFGEREETVIVGDAEFSEISK